VLHLPPLPSSTHRSVIRMWFSEMKHPTCGCCGAEYVLETESACPSYAKSCTCSMWLCVTCGKCGKHCDQFDEHEEAEE
jgi:hypothetical protein